MLNLSEEQIKQIKIDMDWYDVKIEDTLSDYQKDEIILSDAKQRLLQYCVRYAQLEHKLGMNELF